MTVEVISIDLQLWFASYVDFYGFFFYFSCILVILLVSFFFSCVFSDLVRADTNIQNVKKCEKF